MANQSTTGFGLRPIQKIGQNDNNAGLSEWLIAASSAAMYHGDMVMLTADGVVLRSTDSSANNLGSLNGVFYTDPTTSKPTWSNYLLLQQLVILLHSLIATRSKYLRSETLQVRWQQQTSVELLK